MRTRWRPFVPVSRHAAALAASAIVLLTSLIIGCGGSGGSGSTATATSGGTGTTSSGGGTTGTTAVTDSVKTSTFTSIRQKVKSLGTPAAIAASLPAYIKTLPGVLLSEAEADNNISIVFKDGTWATVINNRAATPPVDTTPYPGPGKGIVAKRDIPSGTGVRVVGFFGPPADLGTWNKMFTNKNYDSARETDASLQNIVDVGAEPVTFIDTHGGIVATMNPINVTKPNSSYSLMTNTLSPYAWNATNNEYEALPENQRDPATDQALQNGQLGVGMDPGSENWMICVTPAYLKGKWSFTSNSLLFNSVCGSYRADNSTYPAFCQSAHVSEFIGYDGSVLGGDAASDAIYLFEGLLGTHIHEPSIRGRAWNVGSFVSSMANAGLTTHVDGITGQPIHMVAQSYGTFTQLCPGIQYIYAVDAQKQLVLVGDFGSQPGTVTLNGQELSLASPWTSSKIVCTLSLDPSSQTFSGPVYVTVNNHESNWVNLTKFEAKGTYDFTNSDTQLVGTETQHIEWDLFYHLGLQEFRQDPFQQLVPPPGAPTVGLACAAVSASTASYLNSGQLTDAGHLVEDYVGSGPLVNNVTNPGQPAHYESTILFPGTGGGTANFQMVVATPAGTLYSQSQPTYMNPSIYTNGATNGFTTSYDSTYNLDAISIGPKNLLNTGGTVQTGTVKTNFTTTDVTISNLQEDANPSN